MDTLWAPWRMTYIKKEEKPKGCIFCYASTSSPEEFQSRHVLAVSKAGVVLLNKFPYNNGHLLVAPLTHIASPTKMEDGIHSDLWKMVKDSLSILEEAINPTGFNVGCNLGGAAGAGIPEHFHIHIVPRWHGDTNFMPVVAQAKVMPETLDATWARLRPKFETLFK